MIYSVWNQGKRAYDYFEDGTPQAQVHAPAPKIRKRQMGATVDEIGWKLPSDAVHIGSGDRAKGRIAASDTPGALGVLDMATASPLLVLGAGALVLWYVLRRLDA